MTQSLQETVTAAIIEQLEQGTAPWRKPWEGGASLQLPENGTTHNQYNGINIPLLWISADKQNFTSHEWATYKQWADNKEQVKKGEKGSLIVYYDTFKKEVDGEEKKIPFIKSSNVFNRCQLQSYDPAAEHKTTPLVERISAAEDFFKNTGAEICFDGGFKAFYRPSTDSIHLPVPGAFKGTETQSATEAFYSTMAHETGHWSGTEKRCNRNMGKRFGDEAYAMEELVAELTAAFTCAGLGITDGAKPDNASYLNSWLKVMKADSKAIFTAASEASKAHEFLKSLQPTGV